MDPAKLNVFETVKEITGERTVVFNKMNGKQFIACLVF